MVESLEKAFLDDIQAMRYPAPVPITPADTVIPGESTMSGEPLPGGMTPKEFAVGLADTAAAGLKGAVQGWAGLPGDIESIGRMIINLVGGNVDQDTYLKTTEEIKALLDSYAPFEPMGERISKEDLGVAEIAGEIVAPSAYVKPVKAAAKAIDKGVKSLVSSLNKTKPVKQGHIRLYRGQQKDNYPPAVDWVQGSGSGPGRYYTTDLELAEFYGNHIRYVDVPESIAKETVFDEGWLKDVAYALPAEWANKSKVWGGK